MFFPLIAFWGYINIKTFSSYYLFHGNTFKKIYISNMQQEKKLKNSLLRHNLIFCGV